MGTNLSNPCRVTATVMVVGVGQRRRRERRGKRRQGYFLKPPQEIAPMLPCVVASVL
jgi:hypothetical protein